MSDKHSRTERATPHKRQKTRERGQVFRSREVSGAAGFLAAVVAIAAFGDALLQSMTRQMTLFFDASAVTTTPVGELVGQALLRSTMAGVPVMAAATFASVAGTVLQAAPVVTFEPVKPDPKRLFSLSKLTNAFTLSGAANLMRGIFGLAALTFAGYSVLAPAFGELAELPHLEPPALAKWIAGLGARILFRAAVIFGIIAAVDYTLNRRQHEEQLKMTKQEVKEEQKQHEGDPKIKARVRKVQRAAARNRMMAMVKRATVVVTNPTHVAVALLYDAEESPAPRVVAKGKGELAGRIREIARRSDVVIYEDPPLARALYAVEVGAVIPPALYKAVAEVLAYLVRVARLRL